MRWKLLLALPLLSGFLCPTAAFAQKAGDKVMVKAGGTEIRLGDEVIEKFTGMGAIFTVRKTQDDWLQVSNGRPGWIPRDDVVPLKDAPAYVLSVMADNPGNEHLHNVLGEVYREQGAYERSIRSYDTGLAHAADKPNEQISGYNGRGLTWNRLRQWRKAEADFSKALLLNSDEADERPLLSNRAFARNKLKDYDGAIADCNRGIRLMPLHGETYSVRGDSWFGKGMLDRAIADYNRALELDPHDEYAYCSRARVWSRKGAHDKARSDYLKAIEVRPDDADTLSGAAWFFATCPDAACRNGKKALELARRACELDDWKNGDYIDNLAAAHAELGQFEQAVRFENMALEKAPFLREWGEEGQARLELYRKKVPFREK